MIDYKASRQKMVDNQLRPNDVTNHALLQAMLEVPRESFVPEDIKNLAYIDEDLSLASFGAPERYLMVPTAFAKLVQAAEICETDIILVIGSGCGYSAAVISQLSASVIAVEEDKHLLEQSTKLLLENGFEQVVVLESKLTSGYDKEAPYDVIFIEGAVDHVPDGLLEQLADGGRLIGVEGIGNAAGAFLYKKANGNISKTKLMNCSVKPLPGFSRTNEFVF